MHIIEAIAQISDRRDLTREQMADVMTQVMNGESTPAQIAGWLIALKMKGETVEEITGAAMVMRQLASPVEVSGENLIDTCGTGGDGAKIFNVSTAAAFVAAAAGARVAKHGNRSISSSSGSSDLLQAAGVDIMIDAGAVGRAIDTLGVGFMFAPSHHSATRHAVGPRKELATRTIFNLLGPLTNPAAVKRQVMGVFDRRLCRPIAEVLQNMGSEHVMVVHSNDGLDELSIAAPSYVAELKEGDIREYEIDPSDFGLSFDNLDGLQVADAQESLALIKAVFKGTGSEDVAREKAAAIVTLNAGAAIYVSGVASNLKEGVAMAEDAIASGAALEKLNALVQFTHAISES